MVKITSVEPGSVAQKKGIIAGDFLISIDSHPIGDILDYRFFLTEENITLQLMRDQAEYEVSIRKDRYDDIGLDFETFLMDQKRRCSNKCIFCFIDQNPAGMRETVYFKDDDTRLSFLMGNYVTLTNVKKEELLARKRTKAIAEARQIAMYLITEFLNIPLESVGNIFGKDHATVIYAKNKIADDIKKSKKLEVQINDLKQMIEGK